MHLRNLKHAFIVGTFISICIFANILLEDGFRLDVALAAFIFSMFFDLIITAIAFFGFWFDSYLEPRWRQMLRDAHERQKS